MKKIMLIGNVGQSPVLRTNKTDDNFATFSLGVSVGTKNEAKTDWVDVNCNGKLADFVMSYVKKGSKLFIEGFPSVSAYTNQEGKPTAVQKVYASNLELLNFVDKEEDSKPPSDEGITNG